MDTLEQELLRYFGHSTFREPQKAIVQHTLEGKDSFALLPTGGGKSLCYQLPAVLGNGLTLVVSPLIALMNDQVAQLKALNISAAAIHSAHSYKEIDVILDNAIFGKYKLLYISPERIQSPLFIKRVSRMNVNYLVIDEAHCISDWGYDFRPAYLQINSLQELLGKVPTMALTATATEQVVNDIIEKLKIEPKVFTKSFHRSNLSYLVYKEADKYGRLMRLANSVQGSGIVYAPTRKACREYTQFLTTNGHSASFYHAGLTHQEREERQLDWQVGNVRIMVATNAFGMGINKPDVRFVAHLHLPNNLEAYYQEAGRAGRDGEPAYALVLYEEHDIAMLQEQLQQSYPEKDAVKRVYQALGNFLQLADGAGKDESFTFNLSKFSKTFSIHPVQVMNALKLIEYEGYLTLSDQMFNPSSFQFKAPSSAVYDYIVFHPESGKVLNTLLRSYGGAFDQFVRINEFEIAKRASMQLSEVKRFLIQFQELELIEYLPQSDDPRITFTKEKLSNKQFKLSKNTYDFLKKRATNRLNGMLGYIHYDGCRIHSLLAYFGEDFETDCGNCDYCRSLKMKKKSGNQIQEDILQHLPSNGSKVLLSTIFSLCNCSEELFRVNLLTLEERQKIRLEGDQIKRVMH